MDKAIKNIFIFFIFVFININLNAQLPGQVANPIVEDIVSLPFLSSDYAQIIALNSSKSRILIKHNVKIKEGPINPLTKQV